MFIRKVKGHQYLRHIFDHGPISNSWQIKFRQENKSHDVHSLPLFISVLLRYYMEVLQQLIVNAIAIFLVVTVKNRGRNNYIQRTSVHSSN